MTVFKKQEIPHGVSWGERLRCAREKAKWSLEDAAYELDMRQEYLSALEAMEVHKLPGDVYARHFLTRYAKWLNLDVPAFLSDLEDTLENATRDAQSQLPLERVHRRALRAWPKIMRRLGASFFVLALLSYLGFSFYGMVRAPVLSLEYPLNDIQIDEYSLVVVGYSDPETQVFVNDEIVHVDSEGRFEYLVSLTPGVNVIRVSSKRKFSRVATIERQVLVEIQNDNLINTTTTIIGGEKGYL